MRAADIIRKKRDGFALTSEEIRAFVAGTAGTWPDYQLSALLMAIVLRGMNEAETLELTQAMLESGERLNWSGLDRPVVDKHSTGGVGDKTSLLIAPLAASCGLAVPMMSGRGLGHTGGTLDKLESIPGFQVALSPEQIVAAVQQVGCALIAPTESIAPADRVLYRLRDVTATVDSIPLITASILSKKLAEGIQGLVLDVKCGRGAFMKTRDEAEQLARSLVAVGSAAGVKTLALLTAHEVPLGRNVGNALEVRECVEILRGQAEGVEDVRELSLELTAGMVRLGRGLTAGEARRQVVAALESGQALETFRRIIEQQRGDPRIVEELDRLPTAPRTHVVRADRSGYVAGWDAHAVGQAVLLLGAGRDRAEDAVDPAVGARVLARPGDLVRAGDALLELHYRDEPRLGKALHLLQNACPIVDVSPPWQPLVLQEQIAPE
jgi:pyrimidine-nucleoside phosphorylase